MGLQAKLVPGNGNRNALTKQFAMEYALRYGMLVPGLSRIGLPIPLGGSSNHFRTGPLRKLGGWDAWNVTEDADLGMRCAARGYRVEVLDSVTYTEAPPRLGVFVRQRTRWHKGFLMTAMVHTRRPRQTLRRFGIAGLSSVVGIIAATPVAGLTTPIVLMLLWTVTADAGWSPAGTNLTELSTTICAANAIVAVGCRWHPGAQPGN
ncbi:cellulose synthase/poly-beta-1,6-N-acetylglucosamine synthase-like glycosyltransferase [Nocardia sp. GAS34]